LRAGQPLSTALCHRPSVLPAIVRALMRIGIAKEVKPGEYRVALTPGGALELTQRGHEVVVEAGAGTGSAFPDAAYAAAGARLAPAGEVWEGAELLLKVKEPIEPEYGRLRDDLVLFTYLHLAANEPLTRALVESGATCIAYETVETSDRRLPLLAPMSEVAGRLATQMGAWALEKSQGGRGILLGGVPGVPPAKVVVLGGGIVGYNAALIAVGMQADVWVLDKSVERMRDLEMMLDGRITLAMSNRLQIEEAITDADLVVGAVLIPGARAPRMRTAPCSSTSPSTRAAASRLLGRRRTQTPSSSSTGSFTTASRTCRAPCRSRRRRPSRTSRSPTSKRSPNSVSMRRSRATRRSPGA